MSITVQSISTVAWAAKASSETIVITKPTGLVEGDLMIAHLSLTSDTTGVGSLSGSNWSSLNSGTSVGASASCKMIVLWKHATAADVAATNFTFTHSSTDSFDSGAIYRIDGHSTVLMETSVTSAVDTEVSDSTPAYTNTVTPTYANSLLIFLATSSADSGAGSIDNYAVTTSNPTWTEQYTVYGTYQNDGDGLMGGATAIRGAITATGNATCTLNSFGTESVGAMIVIPPAIALVSIGSISDITPNTATAQGTISNPDNVSITSRGFVWGTTSLGDPGNVAPGSTSYDDFVSESGDLDEGVFTGAIDSLTPGTVYYVRAFVEGGAGYYYGDQISFTSFPSYFLFCQKITTLHRFNKVKVPLKFTGTVNSFNLVCKIKSGTTPTTTLYTSDSIAASTLSTTDHEDVTFSFSDIIDIDRVENEESEFDTDLSSFWVCIEPEDLGTFTLPDNAYSVALVDGDDIDFTGDQFLAIGETSAASTYLDENYGDVTNPDILNTYVPSASGYNADDWTKIFSYTIYTSDGEATRGDITLTVNFIQNKDTRDGGTFSDINPRTDGAEPPFGGREFSDSAPGTDDYTLNIVTAPGGADDDILIGNFSSATVSTDTQEEIEFEFIINKALESGTTIDLWMGVGSDNQKNIINTITLEWTDFSRAYQMATKLVQPSIDEKWLSTLTTNSFNTTDSEVRMVVADNGYSYILDGYLVHQLDGTNIGLTYGNVTQEVLRFPTYFDIRNGLDFRGNIFLAINQRTNSGETEDNENFISQCGVYVWDRLSTQVEMRDYIQISGAKEIKDIYLSPSGQVRAITISANGITEIRDYTGSTFEVIQEVGYDSFPKYPDSLTKAGKLVYWLGNDGKFYAHGIIEGGDKEGLFIFNTFDDLIDSGAILYGGGTGVTNASKDSFYISYKTD